MFCFFLAIGLVGLTRGVISAKMRLFTQFLSLFTLVFGMWFLYESIFVIESLCIHCMFNTFGLLLVNAAWLKINYKEININKKANKIIQNLVEKNYDVFIWLLIAIVITAAAIVKFV